MQIAILDNTDKLVCLTDDYFDGNLHTFLEGTAAFFKCSVVQKSSIAQYFKVGNKLSFIYDDKHYHFDITNMTKNESIVTIQADSLTLELRNEDSSEYKATKAMTFEEYLDVFLFAGDNPIELGINEVSDKKITAEWEGSEDSILARLFSLANKFDAEIEFETVLNRHWGLDKVVLNVYRAHSDKYQGIGKKRTDILLEYGNNVETVEIVENIDNLKTAIRPTGTDGLTIANVVIDEKDNNGNQLFFSKKGSGIIYAPQARDQFRSKVSSSDGYIAKNWTYETKSDTTLAGQALGQLKKLCEPEVTATIKGYEQLGIGDTVLIQNTGYVPTLILSARISEQDIYFDEPSKNTSTFTNVEILQSEVDESLTNRLIKMAKTYGGNNNTIGYGQPQNPKNGDLWYAEVATSRIASVSSLAATSDHTWKIYKEGEWIATNTNIPIAINSLTNMIVSLNDYITDTLAPQVSTNTQNTSDLQGSIEAINTSLETINNTLQDLTTRIEALENEEAVE